MALLAVLASTLVVLAYLLVIWWLDRYEREPAWVLAMTFAWGGLGGTCLAIALSSIPQAMLVGTFGEDIGSVFTTVVIAPVVEEFTKAMVFVLLVLSKHIDSETDGLIYGAATGLGFAAIENLLYYAGAGDGLYETIIIRTLFTTFVHCVSSALIGMGIGWARHRSWTAIWAVVLGYGAAVLTHGTWNGLAVLAERSEQGMVFVLSATMLTGAGVMMFGLTQWMLVREHQVLRRFLEREAAQGTLPLEHAQWIPFWSKRHRVKVPERGSYIRLATLLAFRQHQASLGGKTSPSDVAEIARLREQVRGRAHHV